MKSVILLFLMACLIGCASLRPDPHEVLLKEKIEGSYVGRINSNYHPDHLFDMLKFMMYGDLKDPSGKTVHLIVEIVEDSLRLTYKEEGITISEQHQFALRDNEYVLERTWGGLCYGIFSAIWSQQVGLSRVSGDRLRIRWTDVGVVFLIILPFEGGSSDPGKLYLEKEQP